jgi:SAM-dependent methyltransferase
MAVPGGAPAPRDRRFPAEQIDGAARSARIVVPLVMSIVRDVRSIVDVGCGAGVWIAEFKENGVPRVLGLGPNAADPDRLEIDPDEFHTVDLEGALVSSEAFDLCICLETAQHLPDSAAPTLVQSLCALSDVVLFSAAIPGQGSIPQGNERWPSYWADLFQAAGYEVLDIVRGRIWNDARVDWRYRQTLLLFANQAGLARIANRASLNGAGHMAHAASTPLDVVHPACLECCRLHLTAASLHNASAAEAPKRKKSGWRYLTGSYWQKRSGKLARSVTKRLPWRVGRMSR